VAVKSFLRLAGNPPLLMLGGAFFCYEGAEKLVHRFLANKAEHDQHKKNLKEAAGKNPAVDLKQVEKDKIRRVPH